MNRLSFFGAVAALCVAATPLKAQAPQLPQGEGRDLVAVACTQCHVLAPITAIRLGQNGWRNHVTNMVMRGAQLNAREAETVTNYLTANFGPTAAPPTTAASTITLPNGPGKELVETRCVTCHDLERIAAIKRDKRYWAPLVADMVMRGAPVSAEEAQTIVAYLSAQFGTM
jgi:cytochrome c5